tara:strand:+ start:9819 stop:10301 length:483 start_codon:yes stop_codon:yes gene_type:complete
MAKTATPKKTTKKTRKPVSKPPVKEAAAQKQEKYWEAVGRRKTAVARARMQESKKFEFLVNAKSFDSYFQNPEHRIIAKESLEQSVPEKSYSITVLVRGGGTRSQAEAVRHAIARALVLHDGALREQLKALRHLTRDPRMRERKKFGLKRARRARQWRKR